MDSWLENWLTYKQEHQVIVVLKRITSCLLEHSEKYGRLHLEYYKALNKKGGGMQYGKTLNGDSICILLNVSSDTDFEEIIRNDPALDKLYELHSVTPFSNLL
jgi:hypothetical protein